MKTQLKIKNVLFATSIFICICTNAQNNGRLSSIEVSPAAGTEVHYTYYPPKGLIHEEGLKVKIIYKAKDYLTKTVPLIKADSSYSFSFAVPDSVEVLIIGVIDNKGEVFDNNNNKGYISYLYDKKGKQFNAANITKTRLLDGFASYYLKLQVSNKELEAMYEKEFNRNPSLKTGLNYLGYLYTLYRTKKATAKPQLLSFAKQMTVDKNNENNLLIAAEIYDLLKLEDESKKLKTLILDKHPTGALAKRKFWKEYHSNENRTEEFITEYMNKYEQRFNEIPPDEKDNFYLDNISNYISKNDISEIISTEKLVNDKYRLAFLYNNLAWEAVGEGQEVSPEKLKTLKFISGKSVNNIDERIAAPTENDDIEDFWSSRDMVADTYALILYKSQEYDSAFLWQDKIYKRGHMGIEGKERYALFAEKAKGPLFAKQLIEAEVQNEGITQAMLKQLEDIYKQLNIPTEEYTRMKLKADLQKRENTAKMVKDKFGSAVPKNFQLKDLQGKLVNLSDFKNKVVVLDFWATWCGPCRVSFPKTQEIITKYKEDKELVFLFIDTWEDKKFAEIQKNAKDFLTKNNYSFNVLIDEKNKVTEDYKVNGIPATFILNKKGNIVYMAGPSENLPLEIEAAKAQ